MSFTTRSKDYIVERITNQFEDAYFWPRKLGENMSCLVRYEDKYHQFGGVDFSLKGINFDEKVKYYRCLNQVQKWPGFEVQQKNAIGNIQDGWLVANGLSTDWYSIIGLSTTVSSESELYLSSQITGIDILWVNKKELLSYITAYESIDEIKANADSLRQDGDYRESGSEFLMSLPLPEAQKTIDGRYRHTYIHGMFQLTYSSRIKEQPINLVISRTTLERLPSSRHFVATKDYVKTILKNGAQA